MEAVAGTCFFWTYVIVMTFLLMNVFLAIIVEGFTTAKKKYMMNCESIFATVNAVAKATAIQWNCGQGGDVVEPWCEDETELGGFSLEDGGSRRVVGDSTSSSLQHSDPIAVKLRKVRMGNAHRDSIMEIVAMLTVKGEGEDVRSLEHIHDRLEKLVEADHHIDTFMRPKTNVELRRHIGVLRESIRKGEKHLNKLKKTKPKPKVGGTVDPRTLTQLPAPRPLPARRHADLREDPHGESKQKSPAPARRGSMTYSSPNPKNAMMHEL